MGKFILFLLHFGFTILLIVTIPTDTRWWVWIAYYGFTLLEVISLGIHIRKLSDNYDRRKRN